MSYTQAIEKLTGLNFHHWKFKMRMVLIREGSWKIVNGMQKKSVAGKSDDEDNAYIEWMDKDEKALSTICLAIADSELTYVRNCEMSVDAWKKLGETYEMKSLAQRLYLHKRLYTMQMIDTD